MDRQIIETGAMPWEAWEGFPEAIGVKTLRDDEHCGARTLIVRIPAGSEVTAHSHRGVVQLFVIEGECRLDGENMKAGAFLLMHEHNDVPPIRSREGAIVLVIHDPVDA